MQQRYIVTSDHFCRSTGEDYIKKIPSLFVIVDMNSNIFV